MNKAPLIVDNRKIRLALVGSGKIAEKHLQAIELYREQLELVAVCDINPDTLQLSIEKTGAKGFTQLEQLLQASNADVVILCTPSGLHARQAIKVMQAGKHVVTEKPMATRWHDAQHMIDISDETGMRLFVVKQNRLNPTLRLLKKAIEDKRFGRIYMVNLNVFWTRPQSYYDGSRWRGTWEFDGGAFMNQASHYVDLLDWLIGPVQSIHAMMGTLARDIETEDTGVLNIRWRSGALGSMNVTMLTYPKNLEGSITILGEKGTVKIGGLAVNKIEHWEFADKQPEDETIQQVSTETTAAYGFGHPLYYQNLIEVMRGKAQPEIDGREGLRSLELLVAAYLSARDNQVVSLPLEY